MSPITIRIQSSSSHAPEMRVILPRTTLLIYQNNSMVIDPIQEIAKKYFGNSILNSRQSVGGVPIHVAFKWIISKIMCTNITDTNMRTAASNLRDRVIRENFRGRKTFGITTGIYIAKKKAG